MDHTRARVGTGRRESIRQVFDLGSIGIDFKTGLTEVLAPASGSVLTDPALFTFKAGSMTLRFQVPGAVQSRLHGVVSRLQEQRGRVHGSVAPESGRDGTVKAGLLSHATGAVESLVELMAVRDILEVLATDASLVYDESNEEVARVAGALNREISTKVRSLGVELTRLDDVRVVELLLDSGDDVLTTIGAQSVGAGNLFLVADALEAASNDDRLSDDVRRHARSKIRVT